MFDQVENRKKSFKIYTQGLPDDKGVPDRVYEFDLSPLYTNLNIYTGYYRITIPAIPINKEQEYAQFKEQEEFLYRLPLKHIDGWCCSIDLPDEYLEVFLAMLKTVEKEVG